MTTLEAAHDARLARDKAASEMEEHHQAMVRELSDAAGRWYFETRVASARAQFVQNPPTAVVATEAFDLFAKITVVFPPRNGERIEQYVERIHNWIEEQFRGGNRP